MERRKCANVAAAAIIVVALITAATAKGVEPITRSLRVYARKLPCIQPLFETAQIRGEVRLWLRSRSRVRPEINPLWGGYHRVAGGADIWVLVYSVSNGRFYPQSRRTDRPAELFPRGHNRGRFRTAAYFGGRPGETYEVIAVLARRRASRSLSATLRRWALADDFPGLTADAMPVGLDRKDCARVRLRG